LLRETRSLTELRETLREFPASFAALEIGAENVVAATEALWEFYERYPSGRAAVLAERGIATLERAVREAGAIEFIVSPRELDRILAAAKRHFSGLPRAMHALPEEVFRALPWRRHATRPS
jgi:hypothetical protein